jgi:hypothetical protein
MISQIRDGQFKLNEFFMIDNTAKTVDCGKIVDLTSICIQANIYESILEPAVRAQFEFYEAKGAGDKFVFTDKKIIIDFTTDEDNLKSSIRYELYIINKPVTYNSPDDKALIYKVECVTYEAWKASTIKNTPLARKNIECENMVKAYLNLTKSNKPFFAEKTRGLHAFNFTEKTPFECIDQIRLEHAMSQEFNGHCFYFFENKYGFVFKSMEALIKEGIKNIGDKCFTQSTLTNLNMTGAKWRNILTTKIIQSGNEGILRLIGGGRSTCQLENSVTGEITYFQADPKNLQFETLNEGSASTNLKAQVEKTEDGNEGAPRAIPFDPTVGNAERAEKFNHMPYYMSHFLTVVMQITIYGDSAITVGDVIHCQLPEAAGLTRGEENPVNEDSAITTGNYVVTKCRHMLTFNEKAEYAQGLELVKDGIGGTPQPDTI